MREAFGLHGRGHPGGAEGYLADITNELDLVKGILWTIQTLIFDGVLVSLWRSGMEFHHDSALNEMMSYRYTVHTWRGSDGT